jgi:PilZ domain-containing protein
VIFRTDIRADRRFLAGQSIPSRRHYPRVEKAHGVWVYWNCKGREDTSRVRDLSTGGLFVETEEARDVDATISLDFLVQEGQIRARAVVRHVKPGSGLGLKFTALTEEDGPRLIALMTRLRSLSRSGTNSI